MRIPDVNIDDKHFAIGVISLETPTLAMGDALKIVLNSYTNDIVDDVGYILALSPRRILEVAPDISKELIELLDSDYTLAMKGIPNDKDTTSK